MKSHYKIGAKPHMTYLALICLLLIGRPAEAIIELVTFQEQPLVTDHRGKAKGVLVDTVKELFKRTGIQHRITLTTPARAQEAAQRTPNTCTFPMERSQEREASFLWISPVLISRHGVYSHPTRTFKLHSLEDIQPYLLGSYKGSGIGEYLESFNFMVSYAGNNEETARRLIQRRVDFWISDTVSANHIIKQLELDIRQPDLVFFTTLRAIGCNKDTDPAIVKALQQTLRQMYRDGSIENIQQQTFSQDQ